MNTWWLLLSAPSPAPHNMALDEILWRTAAQRHCPLLRIYAWKEPTVSFGYFQKFPQHLAANYRLVRRPTGGGIVYHVADTTYTLVVPPRHPLYRLPPTKTYPLIHRAVAIALDRKTIIATQQSKLRGNYECFQHPVAGDLIGEEGTKLAGGAQRRSKCGLLHQGSIATTVPTTQLTHGFSVVFDITFTPYKLTPQELDLTEHLAATKYSQDSWNKRFS
ncbi:MAG: lipoate--protein ligase family protein [Verrucomicrobiae bacterium]|nr:lipoate--protein ligase family protein [Verrucomicrobiae bacterium]